MIKNKQKRLGDIWGKVPLDYYQRGVKNNFLQRLWHAEKTSKLKKIIGDQKPKSILDVGCASGYMTNEIALMFPKSKTVGIDVYSKAVKAAQKRYPEVTFKCADAHSLPFPTNRFDLVVSYETIEHVINPRIFLKEIKRVMKKDGVAVVVMDSGNWLFRAVWFIWERTKGKVWRGAHLHPFHHKKLEKLIRSCGFRIESKIFTHIGMEVVFVLKK